MSQVTGPGTLTTAGDTVVNTGPLARTHSMILSGSASAQNVVLEGSADGTTWFTLAISVASQGGTVATNAATANGIYTVTLPVALQSVRARLVSITGGPQRCTVLSAGA